MRVRGVGGVGVQDLGGWDSRERRVVVAEVQEAVGLRA